MGDAPIYGRHLLLKRDRPKQRNPLASSREMMAQSSTPTRVNRYITMTRIAMLATQGATRLGKSGGLQSLSGRISAVLLSEIWLDHSRLILPHHKCFMQLFRKHETYNFSF